MNISRIFAKSNLIILTAAIVFATLFSGSTAPAQAAAKPVTVNVAINGGLNIFSLLKQKGLLEAAFKKYNATVSWSEFTSGPPLLESLASKRVDISLLGDGAALQGLSAGLPFRSIGLVSEGKKLNSILVQPDSKIKSIKDLKGKSVAVTKGTTPHVFLIKALAKSGLTEKDLKIVNLQLSDALPAFVAGKVDAWVTIDPYTTQLTIQEKGKVLAGADQDIQAPVTLIARTAFAKDHPELVTAFLSAYKEALAWQKSHVDDAAQIYAELKQIPAPIVKQVILNQDSTLSPVTKEVIATQQASADVLFKGKFLKKKVKYADSVDNTFVNKVLKSK